MQNYQELCDNFGDLNVRWNEENRGDAREEERKRGILYGRQYELYSEEEIRAITDYDFLRDMLHATVPYPLTTVQHYLAASHRMSIIDERMCALQK